MACNEELLALVRSLEARQRQALDLQAEQIAVMHHQLEHSQARMDESMALQKQAVARQAWALRVLIPAMLFALGCAGLLLVRWLV